MGAKSILLAEHEPAISIVITDILKQRGYEVTTETTAKDTAARFHHQRPDVLILDAHLPDQSGYALCQQLRNSAPTTTTPILLLTVTDTLTECRKATAVGADVVLAKPFGPDDLLAKLAVLEGINA